MTSQISVISVVIVPLSSLILLIWVFPSPFCLVWTRICQYCLYCQRIDLISLSLWVCLCFVFILLTAALILMISSYLLVLGFGAPLSYDWREDIPRLVLCFLFVSLWLLNEQNPLCGVTPIKNTLFNILNICNYIYEAYKIVGFWETFSNILRVHT